MFKTFLGIQNMRMIFKMKPTNNQDQRSSRKSLIGIVKHKTKGKYAQSEMVKLLTYYLTLLTPEGHVQIKPIKA